MKVKHFGLLAVFFSLLQLGACNSTITGSEPDDQLDNVANLVAGASLEISCTNTLNDNSGDIGIDCGDAQCKPLAVCTPGATPTGGPCDSHNDCKTTNNARDPYCFDEIQTGLPGGMCSEICSFTFNSSFTALTDDCAANSICIPTSGFASGAGRCIPECTNDASCRSGYKCVSTFITITGEEGFLANTCKAACTSDAQCPATGECDPFVAQQNNFSGTSVSTLDGSRGGECLRSPEICDDKIDNNNRLSPQDSRIANGATGTDCSEASCVISNPSCTETGAECSDTLNNDNDSAGADCKDADCGNTAACQEQGRCTDSKDNDADRAQDCQDADCCSVCAPQAGSASPCRAGSEADISCTDGVDNDNDGKKDCADPDCSTKIQCYSPF
jgi:hypothetical protein